MLTYGDGVADINIADLVKYHESHDKTGTMTGIRPSSRFGEISVENNLVTRFNEKSQSINGLINGGYFVFNRDFFDYLSSDDACILEKDPLEKLVKDSQLMVYPHEGFWQCMDTYREFELLNALWKSSQAPWRVW
jgi:glucose-1-phosphate cytidylyltransferase